MASHVNMIHRLVGSRNRREHVLQGGETPPLRRMPRYGGGRGDPAPTTNAAIRWWAGKPRPYCPGSGWPSSG